MELDNRYNCKICNRRFTISNNLHIHIKTKHHKFNLRFSCYLCRNKFREQDKHLTHIDNHKEGLSFVLYKKHLI